MNDDANEKVVGKLKDEMHGLCITEFLASRHEGIFNQPPEIRPRGKEQKPLRE